MKQATAYKRKAQLFVHSSSRTTAGVWILGEPCIRLDEACSDLEFGTAVKAALDASSSDVPHPRSWAGLLDPLLKLAGVKSWSAFAKTASCVEIEEDGGKVSIIPTKNLGVRDGFQAERVRAATTHRDALAELGALMRQMLGS